MSGEWAGIRAAQLGLTGRVKEDQFLKLCHNQNPQTGDLLTQRMKTTRWDADKMAEVANRRIFYDFTFSPPKSVSFKALFANYRRLLDSHSRAVRIAVNELQHFAGTRIHQGLNISERLTGNIVCATFRHDTSRALDPHLHTHCVMFNATFDATENRWKALSNYEMLQAHRKEFVQRMSITMNTPATCGSSATRLKTSRAAILKSKASLVNCNRGSPNGTMKLTPASKRC